MESITREKLKIKIRTASKIKLPYTYSHLTFKWGKYLLLKPVSNLLQLFQFELLKPASVLIIIAYKKNNPKIPYILFTKRSESLKKHKGQVSFPGGKIDKLDYENLNSILNLSPETKAALRETEEETGIPASQLTIISSLPKFTTISKFKITPVIAFLNSYIEDTKLNLSYSEIDYSFWASLTTLRQNYRLEKYRIKLKHIPWALAVNTHCFYDKKNKIWGVSGSILKNLFDRLEV